MYKTFQLKIRNDKPEYFDRLFLEAKWYYNTILASDDLFKFDTKSKTVYLTEDKTITETTRYLSSQMRQEIKDRILSNIKGLSKSKNRGNRIGHLKFRKFVNSIPIKNQTVRIKGQTLYIQSLKKKSFNLSGISQLPQNYKIKSASLVRNPGGLYLHVSIEQESSTTPQDEKKVAGIDLGIKDSFTFSDGAVINTNFREAEVKLKKSHKKFSKKKNGSKNRNKARISLAKIYHKLDNQKKDVSNKIINKLKPIKIYYQDEMISNWQKGLFGRKVHKGILGRIKEGLWSNPENVMIPRNKPTTKFCPNCGALNDIELNTRIYNCECGYSMPRDKHSAKNMILFGSGRADVEKEASVFELLSQIECKFLSVKQEANVL